MNTRRIDITALTLGSLLAACGGGGGSAPQGLPVATFSAPGTAQVGAPIALDASGSSSAGGPLTFGWDFGDGQRGGGARIAHVYAVAGSYAVTLTVADGAGRRGTATRSVTVAAAQPPTATVPVVGKVADVGGAPLAGVAASVTGSASQGTTDSSGHVVLTVGVGVDVAIVLTKDGYADQVVVLHLPDGVGADASFSATLVGREAAVPLADAAAGGALLGKDGTRLILPPGSLVGGTGAPVAGAVQVAMTPVDVTSAALPAFPGSFSGVLQDGTESPIVTFGTVEFVPSQGAARLQIAPGASATVELPCYAGANLDGSALRAGDQLPVWSLDEKTGVWIEEGQGTVVASTASPTGLAVRAQIAHLSWWNLDGPFDPYLPEPKCVAQGDIGVPGSNDYFGSATICNMLAAIDNGLKGGAVRAAVAAVTPALPATAATATIPIAGGVPLKLPAGVSVVLAGSALNGLWRGQVTVNGPAGGRGEVVVPLTRVATGGNDEVIAPPFDAIRSLDASPPARFRFTAGPHAWAQVTASQPSGSSLQGVVRLFQGTAQLASAAYGATGGTFTQQLPAAGDYVVEVDATANAPGAYRLQVALLGGVNEQAISLPASLTPAVAAYTVDRYTFSVDRRRGLQLGFEAAPAAALRLLASDGTELLRRDSAGTASTSAVTLPAAGSYALEVSASGTAPVPYQLQASLIDWAGAVPPVGADGSIYATENARLMLDGAGRFVTAYSVYSIPANQPNPRIGVARWDGSSWAALAPNLDLVPSGVISSPCTGFALDANDQPVVVAGNYTAGNASFPYVVERFTAPAGWQPVGPNGGTLPTTSQSSCTLPTAPAVVVGLDGQPIVAYWALVGVATWSLSVVRFDGTSWVGLGPSNGQIDTGGQTPTALQLALGTGGAPVLAWTDGNAGSYALRYAATPQPAWVPFGPGTGLIPGFRVLALALDPAGQPVLAGTVGVCTSGGCFAALGVARFDGTSWHASGAHNPTPGDFLQPSDGLGLVVDATTETVAWVEYAGSSANGIRVERYDGTSWTQLGATSVVGGASVPFLPSLLHDTSGNLLLGLSRVNSSPSGVFYRTLEVYEYSP